MCSSSTPQVKKAEETHALQNQYLDGTAASGTGISIGRKQLKSNYNPATSVPVVSYPQTFPTTPVIGRPGVVTNHGNGT